MKVLKYRMYGFVPYSLSGIQKGIQFGHGVVEYGRHHWNDDAYQKWMVEDKTFIVLNGGTTNFGEGGDEMGTLNSIYEELSVAGIKTACFFEPDLGNQLTSVNFLVDERVWDRKTYPDFTSTANDFENEDAYQIAFSNWLDLIGGTPNYFLRMLLKGRRLA